MTARGAVIDVTHEPHRSTWVGGASGHGEFPIQNLPYGIFSPAGGAPRAGVAIGEKILDLKALAAANLLPAVAAAELAAPTLNGLFGLAPQARQALRHRLSDLLSQVKFRVSLEPHLHDAAACAMHLPATIGDYTDFYAGIHHARAVGRIFRPDMPLQPNYKYLPIGYHGRASSIVPSGRPVVRPKGQSLSLSDAPPHYGPSRQMDYELEMGIWLGTGTVLGRTIAIDHATDHIVGLCLLNDWSARDIQNWERLPLGPFLSKSFQTTISPWVITAESLAPFRTAPAARPAGDPAPLPYLQDSMDAGSGQYSIVMEAELLTPRMRIEGHPPWRLAESRATDLYWTVAQLVTQQASNGCNLNPGDLLGTGTISGATRAGSGSLFELSQAGKEPFELPNGETRGFLEDGDEVIFHAHATAAGYVSIGFGECRGILVAAV